MPALACTDASVRPWIQHTLPPRVVWLLLCTRHPHLSKGVHVGVNVVLLLSSVVPTAAHITWRERLWCDVVWCAVLCCPFSGNLGAIDPAYDVAVTTACPQLDNFVVDTAVGAQRCVDYLRTINGRGKFIILEEVRAAVRCCALLCCWLDVWIVGRVVWKKEGRERVCGCARVCVGPSAVD